MHEFEIEKPDHKLNKREEVRYQRRVKAWLLASKLGDVTYESYEDAYRLLSRCTRWGIAKMRHDEAESAELWNRRWYVNEEKQLEKRCERLRKELRPYGCTIACLGYTTEQVYDYDFDNHRITDEKTTHYLHYFD